MSPKDMDQHSQKTWSKGYLSTLSTAERGGYENSNESHPTNGQSREEEVRDGCILETREKWEMRLLAITCS